MKMSFVVGGGDENYSICGPTKVIILEKKRDAENLKIMSSHFTGGMRRSIMGCLRQHVNFCFHPVKIMMNFFSLVYYNYV